MASFFAPAICGIVTCLGSLRRNGSLDRLRYAFLVGGFASSPLIQAAARAQLEVNGCVVVVHEQPGIAIVQGAVQYAASPWTFEARRPEDPDLGSMDAYQRATFDRFGVGKLRTPRELAEQVSVSSIAESPST